MSDPLRSAPALPIAAATLKTKQAIFPQYLDARLSRKQGRRLTLHQAVFNPTLEEIHEALLSFGYKDVFIVDKTYPRSQSSTMFLITNGCVRVAIKEPQTTHYVRKSEFDAQARAATIDGLDSKHQVLVRVAAAIKAKHPERPTAPTVAEFFATAATSQSRRH